MCEGGPFIWEQAGNKEIKSCLDLTLASSNLLPFVKKMVIDSKRHFTARRIIKKKTGTTMIFTDHYSVKVMLAGLPVRQKPVNKETNWNFNKPGGWENYEKLTGDAADKLKEIVETAAVENNTANETMKKVDAMENNIKFTAFGKTKPPTKRKLAAKKALTNEELMRKQAQTIKEEILKIQKEDKSRIGRIYKMKDFLVGGKKDNQEPAAIRNPANNDLVVAPEEIKKVTLEYCKNNLKKVGYQIEGNNEAHKMKAKLHEMMMEDNDDEDFDIENDDFNEVIDKFRRKSTKAYDLILKSHVKYQEAIFELCKFFIMKEDFPDKFQKTVLHMIKKKGGRAEILKPNRFIHMKEGLARTCEALVVSKIKQPLLDQSTIYQIGGQTNHSLEEHVFTLKSLMGLMEYMNEGVILTLVDIISFFDRENILDIMETFHLKTMV